MHRYQTSVINHHQQTNPHVSRLLSRVRCCVCRRLRWMLRSVLKARTFLRHFRLLGPYSHCFMTSPFGWRSSGSMASQTSLALRWRSLNCAIFISIGSVPMKPSRWGKHRFVVLRLTVWTDCLVNAWVSILCQSRTRYSFSCWSVFRPRSSRYSDLWFIFADTSRFMACHCVKSQGGTRKKVE